MESLIYQFKVFDKFLTQKSVRTAIIHEQKCYALVDLAKIVDDPHPNRIRKNFTVHMHKPEKSKRIMKFLNINNAYRYIIYTHAAKTHDINMAIATYNHGMLFTVYMIEANDLLSNIGKNPYDKGTYSHDLVEYLFKYMVKYRYVLGNYFSFNMMMRMINIGQKAYITDGFLDGIDPDIQHLFEQVIKLYIQTGRNPTPVGIFDQNATMQNILDEIDRLDDPVVYVPLNK